MKTLFAMLAGVREAGLGIELPRAITPAVAGLTVGIFAFVLGFIAVLLLAGRPRAACPAAFEPASPRAAFRPSSELAARAFARMDSLEESGSVSAPHSEPHPLAIIPRCSPAMSGFSASFSDFEMDDGATEIGETIFDEPPRPWRRTDPPRIRPVAPTPPRFPGARHLP